MISRQGIKVIDSTNQIISLANQFIGCINSLQIQFSYSYIRK
jgi:hypothetical protein